MFAKEEHLLGPKGFNRDKLKRIFNLCQVLDYCVLCAVRRMLFRVLHDMLHGMCTVGMVCALWVWFVHCGYGLCTLWVCRFVLYQVRCVYCTLWKLGDHHFGGF